MQWRIWCYQFLSSNIVRFIIRISATASQLIHVRGPRAWLLAARVFPNAADDTVLAKRVFLISDRDVEQAQTKNQTVHLRLANFWPALHSQPQNTTVAVWLHRTLKCWIARFNKRIEDQDVDSATDQMSTAHCHHRRWSGRFDTLNWPCAQQYTSRNL